MDTMSLSEQTRHVALELMAHGQSVHDVDAAFELHPPVEVSDDQWLPLPPERYIENPGYLKLDLMTRGLRVERDLMETLSVRPLKDSARGVGSGIDLVLSGDIWVNAPVREAFVHDSPYRLQRDNDSWKVCRTESPDGGDSQSVVVDVPVKPAFTTQETSTGRLMGELAQVQGGYLILGPRFLDDFWQKRLATNESSGRGEHEGIAGDERASAALFTVDEMLEVIEAAFREGAADYLFLSVGLSEEPDGGMRFLEPYVQAAKRHFNTLLRVNASPPREEAWVDRGYAMGIDSIAFNLEVFDLRTYQQVAPGRAKRIHRDQYLECLARAARIFPNGAVLSHLILGLEPPEMTLTGIKSLCALGVLPTLSVFRPLLGTGLENWPSSETDQLAPVVAYLFHAVRQHRIGMTWAKSISNEITPIEARFFTREDAQAEVRKQKFFLSRPGSLLTKNLAHLRRTLRVNNVSESFDSSGL